MDSPSLPFDLDFTSKLLAGLDLIERKKKNPQKKMEDMDINDISEIPDTPDRLAAMHKRNRPSGPSMDLEISVGNGNIYHGRNSGHHNSAGSSSSNPQDDIDHLFRQASLARKISEILDSKPSPPENRVTRMEAMANVSSDVSRGSERIIDIHKKSPFPLSYSAGSTELRRNGKDPCIESGGDFFSQSQVDDFVLNDHNVLNEWSEELIDLSGSKSPSSLSPSRRCGDRDSVAQVRGRGVVPIDLSSQNSSLFSSYTTQARDSRRKNGKEACSESDGLSGVRTGKADKFDRDYTGFRHRNKGKGIDLGSDPEANIGLVHSRPLQLDVSQRSMGKRRLVRNVCISPCDIAKRNASTELDGQNGISGETFLSFSRISNQNKGKGIDLPSDIHSEKIQTCVNQLQVDAPPRNARQRKLVRNGCISPFNIAKNKHATKLKDSVGNNGKEIPDMLSLHQIQIVSPDAEGSRADKKKGRIILGRDLAAKKQDVTTNSSLNRVCLTSRKDLTVNEDVTGYSEDTGSRTTRNRAGSNPIQGGSSSELESETRRHHRLRNQPKGKRKCSTLRSHVSESSGSSFEDSEILFLQPSGQPSSSNSTKNLDSQQHRGMLGPVIEVDELFSPEGRSSYSEGQGSRVSDDSSARDRQVESDEMLARQLQEEFYHESPGFWSAEEIDANIARSLQQVEDAGRAASFVRDPSIAHLYAAPSPRPSFRNPSARSTTHARVPARNRMVQLRRQFARHEMDLEARLDFLEALEAAFDGANDMPISSHVLQIQRDFNENDYEMLLSLDENNHQHSGASDSQINSLPQSVIQSDNNIEACAVCLETPSVGDIIRHLPCLHKFHKDCIDTWLRRKTSCPVCKSGIT